MPGNEAFLRPDVYVFEEGVGAQPLQVGTTSTAAFVDTATWGPIGKPVLITSAQEGFRMFGDDDSVSWLPVALKRFFQMGGKRCYVVRTAHYANINDPTTHTAQQASVTVNDGGEPATDLLQIKAKYPGTFGNRIQVVISGVDETSHTFDLSVYIKNKLNQWLVVERYKDLSLDETANNFVETRINEGSAEMPRGSQYIEVEALYTTPDKDPVEGTYHLTGGDDGVTGITAQDYVGSQAGKTGLYALDEIDELLNICHPGNTSVEVILGGLNYVYNNPYRQPPQTDLYVYDIPLGYDPQEAIDFVDDVVANATGYEAVYYPWVKINNRYEPLSPFVLGLYAWNDLLYGVWKAPAGVNYKLPVTGFAYDVTLGDHELLNENGINVAVLKEGWGRVVFGARTRLVHTYMRYLNVRRLINIIKKTLYRGGQQFVFEPNAPKTWAKVQDTAHALLMYFHSLGAFAGKTPEESFYAKCDRDTNPPELVEQGIMTCEVGICPVKPAEFVVFNVLIYPEGALPAGEAMTNLYEG